MNESSPLDQVRAHVAALTRHPNGRSVGSTANHEAEAYIADVLREMGYEVEQQRFECLDWRLDGTELWLRDGPFPANGNPFSLACDVTAPIVTAGSLTELEQATLTDEIAVLHGALTATPLFPKNYPFFTVEEHRHVIDLLEKGHPHAVIMVSPMNAHPAPLIEDGDFAIPSVTVAADVGAVLIDAGEPVTLRVRSSVRPGHGANVIGRRAYPARDKIVLCAHFDTKPGTPGAMDNAAGVATLLALAERLSAENLQINVEVVAFNGEDHYAAPGEIAYLNNCGNELGRIALLVNIDGVGLKDQPATIAFFNADEIWTAKTRQMMKGWSRLEEVEPWPESDHSIFAMQGVPCIALTSGGVHALINDIIHTPKDTLDRLDMAQIALVVDFLSNVLVTIGPPPGPAKP